jgi:nitrogen-specific signal transduction histidine kinase
VLPGRANLIVEISDSGTGMTPDVCSRVFEPVLTADTGLPICKAIVQEHLGRIEVESEPGQGTTFRVTLPLDRPRPLDEAGERRAGGIRVPPQAMRLTPVPGTRRPG